MAFKTFRLLIFITVLLKATRGDLGDCTKTTCTTTPLGFNCNVVYDEGVLQRKLPDGALRDLPGTVRGLSLLVSNTDPRSDPTLVISWKPPEVAISVYEVYLITWDNRNPENGNLPFPCMFVVNVTDSSQITKVEFRVTSSTFRNSKDVTVYVNTWLGDREPCFLRQAKVTFYATDTLQFTTAYWNYLLSMALPSNNSIQLSFHPLPNATRHMVQVCETTTQLPKQSGYQCSKFRTLRKGTITGIFQFSKTCATYRIKIIPVPNTNRQVYRIHRFVPALQCPPRDPVAFSLLDTSASVISNKPCTTNCGIKTSGASTQKSKNTLGVILGSVLASLVGLVAGIAFIWKRDRRRRYRSSTPKNADYELLHHVTANNTNLDAESDVEFWNKLKNTTTKNISMLYSEDCECHSETVEALSRCLETLFNCRVRRIDRSQDIATQLGNTHVVLFVNSKNVLTSWNMHRSSLSHSQEPFSRTAFDLGCMIQKLLASYSDRVVMVRLDYTEEQHVIQCKNNHVFNIPRHMSELICRIHELGELAGKDSARKCLVERQEGKDLLFSIEKASQCCGRFRCTVTSNSVVELFQGDAHGVGEPDLAGQGAHVVELRGKALQGEHSGDLHDKALQGAPRIDLHDNALRGARGVDLHDKALQGALWVDLHDKALQGAHGVDLHDKALQGAHMGDLHDNALRGARSGDLHDKALPGAPRIDLHDNALRGARGVDLHDKALQGAHRVDLHDKALQGAHGVDLHDKALQGAHGVDLHDKALQGAHRVDLHDKALQGAHGVDLHDKALQGAHRVDLHDKALQGAHGVDLHDKALQGAHGVDLRDKALQEAPGVVFAEFCWQETPVVALQDIGGHGEHGVEPKDLAGQGTDGVVIRTGGHSHEVALQERHVADTYPWVPPRLEPNKYNSLEEVEEHLFLIIQNYGG
ncbi:uncharacterized protein LOC124134951 [Haliotis rufescens]|uniref:uncharacterized protein LOC124134951 n=1 Tax=Haliotis rufescens TaxID=6454 RepID=UPI00201EE681|nr:uncharacterized protein LOC124134951 [Haliotis rufescens]